MNLYIILNLIIIKTLLDYYIINYKIKYITYLKIYLLFYIIFLLNLNIRAKRPRNNMLYFYIYIGMPITFYH